jgi:UDP-N-acetylmuramoyl-tripeptide--D-alanyl-D-alanine ligase
MDATPISKIADWAGGRLLGGEASILVTHVCSDSRALKPGDFFVALRGENFDGNDFIEEAARLGAAGALVERLPGNLPSNFALVQVKDGLQGLQRLSGKYRETLQTRIIGVTGSNGKTSTKDLTAAVLGQRMRTAKTEGNLNNHIGVPLTLLKLSSADEMAVVEIGMNHPGEIAPLAGLTKPEGAIITNIGMAHIEFMGSRQAIAQEKGSLAEAVGPEGTVVLNADDDMTPSIARRCRAQVITAGLTGGHVRATEVETLSSGMRFKMHARGRAVTAMLPVLGEHMVRNATLACAAGLAFGISLEECAAGLHSLQLTKGRLQQKEIGGLTVLDDSYNANPDSMIAGIATLAALPGEGRRIAVLGRMAELGVEAEAGHRRVGRAAGESHLACVVAVGEEARWIAEEARNAGVGKVLHVGDTEAAAVALRAVVRRGDLVLVKGSRSARMERVVEALEKGGGE